MVHEIRPFTIDVAHSDLDDLRARIRATRWPDRETVDGWAQGVPLAVMRELARYWADEYDWRRVESRLNAHPQFTTRIDGVDVHFLHVRSPHPEATPLLLTHGWPGSVIEFLRVIEPLTDPERHGGRPEDAFHLVLPSVPGYGFSSRPREAGWGIERIARAWAELMARLGYRRYGAGGGDWGTSISTMVGVHDPQNVIGLYLTPPLVGADPATLDDLTEAEQASLDALAAVGETGSGYAAMHSTRPQTLGYALLDSPVGQAAWIFEKFAAWVDGDPLEVLGIDAVLDDITLYWLTGTGASSTRLYWESYATVDGWFTAGTTDTIDVPVAASVFRDIPRPSRRWAERRFTDIRYWNEPERGGHFAAFEQPELFVQEVRAAFRALR
ncbi:pimeloyl-ACP methyl ester carboxylesterase [Diaminobutyricimonas aerilata]|uniref:Pimeloyl-ACP methyl ester carboxylesterase n=1 Tax=Diaminobutyricimonas aerilata TaxID=1162967 RepID=A0A2M9CG84_9MICO|nr:epoxide hydrolase family protein [Diaminobutyricimonas aerilata]PJJ70888.1 pimeloyl-ACP methyl ester carboxylesterase [Diaminobutyricimonas aerilata]